MNKKLCFAALSLLFLLGGNNLFAQNSSNIEFQYEAGAELVSSYLWRGQYLGGLSFQPEALVGFDARDNAIQFRAGLWASVGASDWKFENSFPAIPNVLTGEKIKDPRNTYFVPEIDVILSVTGYGASVGFNHYYYCDGSNFFSWQNANDVVKDDNYSSTEFWFGYNFDYLFGQSAYINWYTTIAGRDVLPETDLKKVANGQFFRRAFSTYIELGYDYTFEDLGLTLGAQIGISPWRSDEMYYNESFDVVNIALRADKEWDLGVCTLDLFAVGSLNPDGLDDKNVFIPKAGDDKRYLQKLNGSIGVGVWF